jgi:hypothetical protein
VPKGVHSIKSKNLNFLITRLLRFSFALLSGLDGTRTRDPLRDRQVF